MSKARLIITAVVVEGRSQSDVAAEYDVSKGWVSKLIARYRAEGEAAYKPKSKRPHTNPNTTSDHVVDQIVTLRNQLKQSGHDAGPETIAWHLKEHHNITVSRSTIWRVLHKNQLITPQPRKKPRSAYIRFAAEQPNQMWQSDFTHIRLADGTDTEVITWLDDHSRYALNITAHQRATVNHVKATFLATVEEYGPPAATLTDNGMVYTTRYSGGKGGRNSFETELDRIGTNQKNTQPNHPTTTGKVERFQQTMKNWIKAQQPPRTITDLQSLLHTWQMHYNKARPHRSLNNQTPEHAYHSRPKATPTQTHNAHYRVRHDKLDTTGKVTLRYNSQLYKIGIGRTHARKRIIMLIHDLNIRVIELKTGEILRELTLDPTRKYQPQQKNS